MITTDKEYYKELYRIQDENFPTQAVLLPSEERIYDIDLSSRTIKAPEFLSTVTDHKSEVVYFKVDRFFDYMDLTNTACVIQYINADKESHYYPVPFYDVYTFAKEDKLLFPWVIDGAATQAAGPVKFSIRFYRIDDANTKFVYNLTTLPATSQVRYGIEAKNEFKPEDYEIAGDRFLLLQQELRKIEQKVIDQLYWLNAD